MSVRVAVIGVGAMGLNHVRVYHEMQDVELVGVADTNAGLANRVGKLYQLPFYEKNDDLFREACPDAVSVAVPTKDHFPVVMEALKHRCHVLVEKPIAASIEEGCQLIDVAQSRNLRLMVGHIERFNPAIVELKRRLDAGELGKIFQIYARRLGPFPARIRDVGVAIDLATHDLDIMRYLTGSEAVRVYAETRRQVHESNEDMVAGLIRFQNGTLGILEINWLTPTKIRELYVTGERGLFLVNYLTQDIFFYQNEDANGTEWSTLSILRGVSEGQMIRFKVKKIEPLRTELEAFISSIKKPTLTLVTGKDGIEALRLAQAMIRSSCEGSAIVLNRDSALN